MDNDPWPPAMAQKIDCTEKLGVALREMARQQVVARDLLVEYSVAAGPDSGGWTESIKVRGGGSVDIQRGRIGAKATSTLGHLSPNELLSLVHLLVEIEVWKNLPFDSARPPPPGRFPDRLYVSTGGVEMNVADWTRDNRIQRVRKLMLKE